MNAPIGGVQRALMDAAVALRRRRLGTQIAQQSSGGSCPGCAREMLRRVSDNDHALEIDRPASVESRHKQAAM